jgi:Trk K+ transport system NAD-binding subunit
VPEISSQVLSNLDLGRAESVVLMLSDKENYEICELIYEEFGVENVIVRLHDRSNFEKFHDLGAIVVEPWTSMVSLLDQFVRSPYAASLLLGMDPDEEFMELEMNNPDLSGVAIRDIHFPHDVLILSVSRKGDRLDSHGYTRFETGDVVTVVGSPDGLAEVQARFEVALKFSKN